MTLTVGSLFSGSGGFDLGFERAGMTVRWQSEIDKHASTVLRHHWPKVRNYGDITTTGRLPAVDLVCGGFPCQDISVAGRRAGLAGERSGLWWEFRRVLAELRPRWVVIENVPGLLSSNRGNDMGTILWALGQLGYGWAYRVLDAQWFGLAQRRKRVFIVGHLGDRRAPAQVLFEPESSIGDSPPRRTPGQDVAGPLTQDASSSGGFRQDLDGTTYIPLLEVGARTNSDGDRDGDGIGADGDPMYTLQAGKQHGVAAFDVRQITSRDNRSSVAPGKPVPTLNADGGMHIAFSAKDYGADAGDVSPTLRAMTHDQSHANGGGQVAVAFEPGSIARRAVPRGVSETVSTLRAKMGDNQPAVMTSMAVRRLTPRECERLQGFPDDFTLVDGMSDSARYRLMGNAVAVPVAEWIGRRIMQQESNRE